MKALAFPVSGFGIRGVSVLLTFNAKKQTLYTADPAYRAGLASTRQVFGNVAEITRFGLALLRPDAFYFRKADRILDILRRNDFYPVAMRRISISHTQVFELWRYQLNKATDERLWLGCEILGCESSLLLLLRSQGDHRLPAAVRLWALKGAFDAEAEAGASLRDALCVQHRLFGFLHAADEPIDVIRELGILLPHRERTRLLIEAGSSADATAAASSAIAELYGLLPGGNWMSLQEAISSLCASWERKRRDKSVLKDLLSLSRQKKLNGEFGNGDTAIPSTIGYFDSLLQLLDPQDKIGRWLLYIIAAQVLPMNREGVQAVLSSGLARHAAAQWADRRLASNE